VSATRDSIAGVAPKQVFVPDTIEAAAARIAESERRNEAVVFIGGGTSLDLGAAPERLDVVIRTEKLNRVIEHAPSDQIIAVEAGVSLAHVQDVAKAHGQRLALDPPFSDRATIGGIIATNAFGPLRTRYGSVRDLIIGISIVRADGVIAHGGGKVVKNVAGFDLPKLMVGSLGTLGMIATATFRLHPLPEASETLLIGKRSAAAVRALIAEMKQAQLEAVAVVAIGEGRTFDVAVRFEGFRAGVIAQRDRWSQQVRARGTCDVLDEDGARRLWLRHDSIRAASPLRLKIAVLPSAIEMLSDRVLPPLLAAMTNGGFVWYPMSGTGFVTGAPADDQRMAAAIRDAREVVVNAQGSLTIEAAPLTLRPLVSTWDDPKGSFALMQAMKQRFDPGRRLAPGRFVGGI
jgi:glycolate dehydrogenase FAD-binding subunit